MRSAPALPWGGRKAAPALWVIGGGTAPDPSKLRCPASAVQAHAGRPHTAPVLLRDRGGGQHRDCERCQARASPPPAAPSGTQSCASMISMSQPSPARRLDARPMRPVLLRSAPRRTRLRVGSRSGRRRACGEAADSRTSSQDVVPYTRRRRAPARVRSDVDGRSASVRPNTLGRAALLAHELATP